MAKIYDMMREKARAMGHAAAGLPDSVWQEYSRRHEEQTRLAEAKMYMEHYMMGNLEPSEFAQVMVENNQLRYAISDLCRMRLEPPEHSLQHNGDYIDLKAGVKTFWTEIRVPLPSERDAARDIQNINAGIRAQRWMDRKNQQEPATGVAAPEKIPLRDRLRQARQAAAGKAIDLLTPFAEDSQKGQTVSPQTKQVDDSWLETDAGKSYKSHYTHDVARQLENVAMTIEAAKDQTLDPVQRKRAFEAAGLSEEAIRRQMTETELNDAQKSTRTLRSGYTAEDLNRPLDDHLQTLFDQISMHIQHGIPAEKTKPQAERPVERSVERPVEQQADRPAEKQPKKEPVRSSDSQQGFSRNEEKNRIYGMYEGKRASFKGSAFGHEFTDQEASKLLAGEEIRFPYSDLNGMQRTMIGKLDWQTYNGKTYLGFRADFDKVREAANVVPREEPSMDYYLQMAEQGQDYDAIGADLAEKVREIPLEMPDEAFSLQ